MFKQKSNLLNTSLYFLFFLRNDSIFSYDKKTQKTPSFEGPRC